MLINESIRSFNGGSVFLQPDLLILILKNLLKTFLQRLGKINFPFLSLPQKITYYPEQNQKLKVAGPGRQLAYFLCSSQKSTYYSWQPH